MAGEYHSLKKQQYLNLIKECAHSGKNKREYGRKCNAYWLLGACAA